MPEQRGVEMRGAPTVERHRVTDGPMASEPGSGPLGAFKVPGPNGTTLFVVSDPGSKIALLGRSSWEHVSVFAGAKARRTPTWKEIEFVREAFWNDDELVVVFSMPRRKDRPAPDPYTIHLWRPLGASLLVPEVT